MIYIISGIFTSITRWQLRQALNNYKKSSGPRQSLQLARLLMKSGSGTQAVRVLTLAKRRYPEHKRIQRAYRTTKRQQASRALKRVERRLKHDRTLRLLSKACDLCCATQQYDKATGFADEATKLYPDNWQTHFILGKLYFQRSNKSGSSDDHEQAITHIDRAYQLNPDDYDVLLLLAISLARVEEYGVALEIAGRIIELWPEDPRASQLVRHVEQVRDSSPDGPFENEFNDVVDSPTNQFDTLLDQLRRVEGQSGAFIIDAEGAVIRSSAQESDNFTLSEAQGPIESMIRACHVEVSRIGIGQFQSCLICGIDWQVLVRSFDLFDLVVFCEGSHGEELDNEISDLVENSAIA